MFRFVKRFTAKEDGAITVDWVVLTAAVVGLGVVAVAGLQGETGTVSDRTAGYLDRQEPTANVDIQDSLP